MNYRLKDDGSFIIKDYNQTPPFSNFLPGISGEWGIPLWVFYVNRAQGVVSFGLKDKDHSISEFFPANKAYSFVSSLGFRTFLKINQEKVYEPFRVVSPYPKKEEMLIKSASLEIRETNPHLGLSLSVKYFTLPNTPVGGLVRVVTIKNISKEKINLEILDGLSRIIPFGATNSFLKEMSRTLEAWMKSYLYNNLAIFKLSIDPRDISHTRYIEGANFNYSFYEKKGKKISPYLIVDPTAIFAQDTSYTLPVNFLKKSFKVPLNQITLGRTPCAFSHFKWRLAKGKEQTFYSVFGSSFKLGLVREFVKSLDANFLQNKEKENEKVIAALKDNCLCLSALFPFNHYIQSSYLDNVLRGGFPYCLKNRVDVSTKNKGRNVYPLRDRRPYGVYYIFSRKHGDLERDYNHFQLLPSYFSEGESSYRDINQNRRMDLFFEPELKAKNIIYFLNFIKIDGYNPLIIKGEKLYLGRLKAQAILKKFDLENQRLLNLMLKGFYLGEFFTLLEEEKIKVKRIKELLLVLLEAAEREPQASHGEGYWIDHWHYNLDLIENFLYFYPDKLKELFLAREFLFWDDEYCLKPRYNRYSLRGGKIYQLDSLGVVKEKRVLLRKRKRFKNFLRTKSGKVYRTNLICKLLTLILNKAATLDPQGIGIEMEADKPGWCDSLNGLPALFGSSLCETLELKRAAVMLSEAVNQLQKEGLKEILVPWEVFLFFKQLGRLLRSFLSSESKQRDYLWWERANSLKEDFRQKTFFYLSGKEKKLSLAILEAFLRDLITKLNIGINKAKDKKSKLPLTYFTYTVTKYQLRNKHIIPLAFTRKSLPLSLEGVMHALRVEGKKSLHQNLKKSELFDKKLKMLRLNASLAKEPLEIGRSRVFVPGWLENESIWLHMEYKYLLELLKKGFYEEFFTSFYNWGVCFFNPQRYGRSILENSSFIVSSAYPDRALWGKGFIARLSGATAELLNIWILLCLGKNPFFIQKKEGLCLNFSPILKKEFFTTAKETINFGGREITLPKNTFSFKLFSHILVVYHNPKRKDTFAKTCRVEKIVVTAGGQKITCFSNLIKPPLSLAIRSRKAERIDVYLD